MNDKTLRSTPSLSDHTTNEIEVFPGVMERRYFLRSSVTTVAAVLALHMTGWNASAQEVSRARIALGAEKLNWEDFLKESIPVAQQLVADSTFSIDEYLYRIGSLATRLEEIPDTQLFPYTAVDPRVFFAPSFRGSPFFIIQWRMEAGAVLPPHNHPNASVCTLGYEGEVWLRNFEIVGEAPPYASKKTFRVRETHNELMTRGRINTLSSSRDNIHHFRVGRKGARGIDITTLHGKPAPFSFLDISEEPADAENRIFEATWNDLGRKSPVGF
ncbi:MAG TPA: hypothetical protein VJ124_07100 [Pyrinomonadaceae bacterium]|nr:hypothetical protein [Pyrinomonadaceae bacterium]